MDTQTETKAITAFGLNFQFRLLFGCLAAAMVLSAIDRTDANWDLQNYHLYAPYALLNGRLGRDYFAAGFQGYFNPAEDLPYYVTKMIWFPHWPVLVAALAGLPYGILAFCTFNIARTLLLEKGSFVWCTASLIGLTGSVCLSEVGTTYDDILIGDFVLFGVWMLLRRSSVFAFAVAGFCFGGAVGLKFTAAAFVPAAFVLALLMRPSPKMIFALGGGMALGFLVSWGWWGVLLWQHFSDPIYPMPYVNEHDTHFYPKSFLGWLFAPFFWLQGHSFVAGEEPIRDARLALSYAAFGFIGLLAVFGKYPRPTRILLGFYGFFISGYIVWLLLFSIIRYAIPLEVLTGVALCALVSPLLSRRALQIGLVALLAFMMIFTKPMGWGRIGYGKVLIDQPLPTIPSHSLVFMGGAPVGYVVPYLHADDSEFANIFWIKPGSAEFLQITQLLKTTPHVEFLTNTPTDQKSVADDNARLAMFGKHYEERDCTPISSPIQKTIRLCVVTND